MPHISGEVRAVFPIMIETRRDLHRHPELGFQERRTAEIVARRLTELGYTVRAGLGTTGVMGVLRSGKPGKTILLRADIDALPIQEEADVVWRSQTPGVMHACGHDAHTAMGLAVADLLAKEIPSLGGSIVFIFQPAEELLTGAAAMLKDGALDGIQPDAAFAVHVNTRWPLGTVAIHNGAAMTSADKLTLSVTGRGGHGASPQLAIDPVVAAAQIIMALQTLVSRETSPLQAAILSITTLKAGTAFNIIPDTVEMTGTFRCLDSDLRKRVLEGLARITEGIAAALRCRAQMVSEFLTPPLVNDPGMVGLARDIAAEIVGKDHVIQPDPMTGSDDLAYFWQRMPGCYAFVGSARPEWSSPPAHHNAKFEIDEAALEIGAEFLLRAARRVLTIQ
jgi:amidohydrolase